MRVWVIWVRQNKGNDPAFGTGDKRSVSLEDVKKLFKRQYNNRQYFKENDDREYSKTESPKCQ